MSVMCSVCEKQVLSYSKVHSVQECYYVPYCLAMQSEYTYICTDCYPHSYSCAICGRWGRKLEQWRDICTELEQDICPDCIHISMRCADCATWILQDDIFHLAELTKYVCRNCAAKYTVCESCNRIIPDRYNDFICNDCCNANLKGI